MRKFIYIVIAIIVITGMATILRARPGLEPSIHDVIKVTNIKIGDTISSPVTVKGEARGNWYFEASFPVVIVDWDGRIIADGPAQAKGDWMTTDYVPFEVTLTFTKPEGNNFRGAVILRKDNPSGLPANDMALEIPVTLQ